MPQGRPDDMPPSAITPSILVSLLPRSVNEFDLAVLNFISRPVIEVLPERLITFNE
jgi:hypothetical protein